MGLVYHARDRRLDTEVVFFALARPPSILARVKSSASLKRLTLLAARR
jgi:hypothetical protein